MLNYKAADFQKGTLVSTEVHKTWQLGVDIANHTRIKFQHAPPPPPHRLNLNIIYF